MLSTKGWEYVGLGGAKLEVNTHEQSSCHFLTLHAGLQPDHNKVRFIERETTVHL